VVGGRERRNWVEEKRREADPPGKSARADPTSGLRRRRGERRSRVSQRKRDGDEEGKGETRDGQEDRVSSKHAVPDLDSDGVWCMSREMLYGRS